MKNWSSVFSTRGQARSQLYHACALSGHLEALRVVTWAHCTMHVRSTCTCRLNTQWLSQNIRDTLFHWKVVCVGHVLKQKYPLWEFFLFHFLCSIFLFWVSRDNERLTYPLLGAWIPKTLWCDNLYYLFNVISVLLLPFYLYCLVCGLIIHLHVC